MWLTRLNCAKMAERIKVLFGVNSLGYSWNLVFYTRGSCSPTAQGSLPVVDPLHISGTAEARDLKFCVHIDVFGPAEHYATVGHMGSGQVT